jgi:RNA polymerase sigma factor (sigma-70 family)
MAKKSLDSVLQYLRRVALTGDDAHLLERFARHRDETAFERLVLLHGPMVLGLCHRLLRHEQDAEDAFQATFLTLARKASTIGKKEALASWLYKVAYRIGCRARGAELTNRMSVLDKVGAKGDADISELRGVLHEEIAGLTDAYRGPVVLCYLQGKTHEEAARLLGCPKGTVASRLTRAKEQLRRRLTRRGWTLSASVLTTVLTDKALAVPLPAGLVASTLAYVSGKSANAAAVAAKVFALSDGVLRMLWLNKMKMGAGVILAVVLAGTGIGLVVRQTWASGEDGDVGNKAAQVKAQKAAPKANAFERTRAEIADLRKEVANIDNRLDSMLKEMQRMSDSSVSGSAKAAAPAVQNKGAPDSLDSFGAADIDKDLSTNAALADERLTGKRVRVKGKVVQITRSNAGDSRMFYILEMVGENSSLPAFGTHAGGVMYFQFGVQERGQLAKLRPGQLLVVEGTSGSYSVVGIFNGTPRGTVSFSECKIIE